MRASHLPFDHSPRCFVQSLTCDTSIHIDEISTPGSISFMISIAKFSPIMQINPSWAAKKSPPGLACFAHFSRP